MADVRPSAEDEVVDLAAALIRIDTTNTGDATTTVGERAAAEFVVGKLAEVGYAPETIECGSAGRDSVFVRISGSDPGEGALLVHGHLDVVPADASEWSVHPFAGVVQDGCLWGRGAVDMKDMVAMMLAVARQFKRDGIIPARDIVLGFLSDEEAGGRFGARWLVDHRKDLFKGCTDAVGEVGGFSLTVPDRSGEPVRLYPLQVAEKGIGFLLLRATGQAGHSSYLLNDNAISTLANAVARIGDHRFPVVLTEAVRELLATITDITGLEFPVDDLDGALGKLGSISAVLSATIRDTAIPTLFNAGYKLNVVPSSAEATIDCRLLPGRLAAFEREIDELIGPDVTREWLGGHYLPGVSAEYGGGVVAAMNASLRAEDPGCRTAPYMPAGGTDAKTFTSALGIRCYGFVPLRLPRGLNFAALFHGVDERVPVDSLEFGARVFRRFLQTC